MIRDEIRNIQRGRKDVCKFALTIAIALGVLGGLLLWRGKGAWPYFLIASPAILFVGMVAPTVLKPVYIGWMTFSILLGWVMTRVVLCLLFFLVVTPTSLVAKVFRKRFLELKFDKDAQSYWIARKKKPFAKSDYERLF